MSDYRGELNPNETETDKKDRLLRNWAEISKALGLELRDASLADYDDELASMLAYTAQETRKLFDHPR